VAFDLASFVSSKNSLHPAADSSADPTRSTRTALLVDACSDETIASEIELASTRATRRRGLLGRDGLGAASALIIAPCCAIHTVGMRFAIDVIFVDRKGRVVRTAAAVPPWRIAIAPRAYAAIEMAAGSVAARGVQIGDSLAVRVATQISDFRFQTSDSCADGRPTQPRRDLKSNLQSAI
jgi:uncharacterized membrane protein (UPF0127 family)